MLGTHDRSLLLESLRPPDGYSLDRAIGTTFSLDLLALLTVPLAFTFFDWEDDEGKPTADPLAMLQALRRHAGRIVIFCQAGQIAIPGSHKQLYAYLEESVVEVRSPSPHGIFHPKVWVLRFTADNEPVRYRFLCLTRNLTFDRCWDTILSLEGELTDRTLAFKANHPLGNFIQALPGLALRATSDRITADVNLIQDELRRVRFQVPEGFTDYTFWPLGLPNHNTWPFQNRIDRMLVVSPFLSAGCLARLTNQGRRHVLISRLECLAELKPATFKGFEEVYALNPNADPEPTDEGALQNGKPADAGLHAKLFVAEAGWDASVWTGSANATNPAFKDNVEFLVELIGKKSAVGVDVVLGRQCDRGTLRELLVPYDVEAVPQPPDPEVRAQEELIDAARRDLVAITLEARVEPGAEERVFALHLGSTGETSTLHLSETLVRGWGV